MKLNNPLYKDIIIAGAIGDAFGYLVEFDPVDWIEHKFNKFTLDQVLLERPLLNVSDDTQMTLFCMEGILKSKDDEIINVHKVNADIFTSYLDWYYTQNFRNIENKKDKNSLLDYDIMYRREAPGNTCLGALCTSEMGLINYPINDSKGCGGIMRVAPVAFMDLSLDDTFHLGATQAAITHGHSDGYLSAGYFAALLKLLIDGKKFDKEQSNILKEILNRYNPTEHFTKYVERMVNLIFDESDIIYEKHELTHHLGLGWVGDEALGIAAYCAFKTNSFDECLRISAHHNGDSDSTASLAAQLFIAKGGLMNNYVDILNRLNAKDAISFILGKMQ